MGYKTELNRVRGLGSAKHGAHHWIVQRATALGNVLLIGWLFLSLLFMPNFSYEVVSAWMAQPVVSTLLILLLLNVCWHARLGLQVFLEDYVHEAGMKVASLMALNFYIFGIAAFGVFAIAKHAFAGVAV